MMQGAGSQSSSSGVAAPDTGTLLARLGTMLGPDRTIDLLLREPNVYSSSSPSEVVTVSIDGGPPTRLFCKFFRHERSAADRRTGSAFNEVLTFRHVLRAPLSYPRLFGSLIDEASGEAWLAVEYMPSSIRLSKVEDHLSALESAARWIGEFHFRNESRLREPDLRFLRQLDRAYFHEHLLRTVEALHSRKDDYPWLARLRDAFQEVMEALAESPFTVIHAEYYPQNILVANGNIYPVDWETTSIAHGEIDLAMLLTNWGVQVENRCITAYAESRRLSPTDIDWRRRLAAARVLVDLRWLGYRVTSRRARDFEGHVVPRLERLRDSWVQYGFVT